VDFTESQDGLTATNYGRWTSVPGETAPLGLPVSIRIAAQSKPSSIRKAMHSQECVYPEQKEQRGKHQGHKALLVREIRKVADSPGHESNAQTGKAHPCFRSLSWRLLVE
jgi:hypothetical protein